MKNRNSDPKTRFNDTLSRLIKEADSQLSADRLVVWDDGTLRQNIDVLRQSATSLLQLFEESELAALHIGWAVDQNEEVFTDIYVDPYEELEHLLRAALKIGSILRISESGAEYVLKSQRTEVTKRLTKTRWQSRDQSAIDKAIAKHKAKAPKQALPLINQELQKAGLPRISLQTLYRHRKPRPAVQKSKILSLSAVLRNNRV